MRAVIRVLLTAAAALSTAVALAQVVLEFPPPVPADIREPSKTSLVEKRTALERMRQGLGDAMTSLRNDCSHVDTQDAARVAQCKSRNQQLREGIVEYRKQLGRFHCALAGAAMDAL